MAFNDLATVRRGLGKMLNIHTQVTTSGAGTTTTLVATALSDYFPAAADVKGRYAHRQTTSEWRRITAYNTSTFTATLNRAMGTTIAGSTVIDLYAIWDPSMLDRAIEQACDEVYPDLMNTLVDESLTTVARQYEYTVPTAIRDLHREWGAKVWVKEVTTIATFPYAEILDWEVRDNEGVRKLVIPVDEYMPAGRTIRLRGYAPLAFPASDAATFPLTSEQIRLLQYKAASILFLGDANENSQDRAFNREQSAVFEAKYQKAVTQIGTLTESGRTRRASGGSNPRRGDIAEYATPS